MENVKTISLEIEAEDLTGTAAIIMGHPAATISDHDTGQPIGTIRPDFAGGVEVRLLATETRPARHIYLTAKAIVAAVMKAVEDEQSQSEAVAPAGE